MTATFKVACVQNGATADMDASLAEATALARAARAEGAELICLPEYVSCLEVIDDLLISTPHAEAAHPALPRFAALARELGAWLLVGSLAVTVESGKVVNRSYLLDQEGRITARYDKIHLFDVQLGGGEVYRESATVEPGDRAVLAETPWGPLGMTVCYDLRFPQLYHALAKAGALYLAVPAAFTKTTGQAHWHVLQRARAIETGCYVFAPCQYGDHGVGKASFGHSLIVDPWGRVLADGGEGPGVITAEVDPAAVAEARRKIPALEHARPFAPPVPPARVAAAS
ncbi:MAG: carbon-nitrogen hydrolase family protein [Rhodospirillales bacterium]|nr:carbon-nitrogen hydrolase family protein [Rhodospirillales bacterium]